MESCAQIYLGTVLLERNRWGKEDRRPTFWFLTGRGASQMTASTDLSFGITMQSS